MTTRGQTINNNVIHLRNISPSSYYVVATSSAINGRDYSKNDFSIYNDSELRYNGTLSSTTKPSIDYCLTPIKNFLSHISKIGNINRCIQNGIICAYSIKEKTGTDYKVYKCK